MRGKSLTCRQRSLLPLRVFDPNQNSNPVIDR
jgi:hypothetical protein